jgi:hypothetical protein
MWLLANKVALSIKIKIISGRGSVLNVKGGYFVRLQFYISGVRKTKMQHGVIFGKAAKVFICR